MKINFNRVICIGGLLLIWPKLTLAAADRELIFVRGSAVRQILGFDWGSICNSQFNLEKGFRLGSLGRLSLPQTGPPRGPAVNPEEFFSWVQGNAKFHEWSQGFKKRTVISERKSFVYQKFSYSWSVGSRIFCLFQPRQDDIYSTVLLMEDGVGRSIGALRIRSDGVEEEIRRLFEHRFPLAEYRKIKFARRPRSFLAADVSAYEVAYLSNEELQIKFEVTWGSNFGKISSSKIVKGFTLQDPRDLFLATSWFIPEWRREIQANGISLTAGSWSLPSDPATIHYPFRNSDNSEIRIFVIDRNQGLKKILQYFSDGRMLVSQRSEDRVKTRKDLEGAAFPGLSWGMAPPDKWSQSEKFILVNPQEFFRTSGYQFIDWRARFENGLYAYDTDQSWFDREGNRYYIFVERGWPSYWTNSSSQQEAGRPSWFVQKYIPRGESWALEGLFLYDASWNELQLQPSEEYTSPGRYRLKRLLFWIADKWILLSSFVLVVVILLWRSKVRESKRELEEVRAIRAKRIKDDDDVKKKRAAQEEERQKDRTRQEQEVRIRKLERERHDREEVGRKQEFALRLRAFNRYLETGNFEGASQYLKEVSKAFPAEKAAIFQAEQRIMEAEQRAIEEKSRAQLDSIKRLRSLIPPPEEEEV